MLRYLLTLFLLVSSAEAASTLIQAKQCGFNNGFSSPATCSFTSNPTAGNTIVVSSFSRNSAGFTVTDNQGNSYTSLVSHSGSSLLTDISASANVVSSGTFTVSVAVSGGEDFTILNIEEWSGMPTTLTSDGTASDDGNNSGSTQGCGTLTTTTNGDVLLGVVGSSSSHPTDETAPTGWTRDTLGEASGGFGSPFGSAFASKASSTVISATITFSSTNNDGQWNCSVVALLGGSSGSGVRHRTVMF